MTGTIGKFHRERTKEHVTSLPPTTSRWVVAIGTPWKSEEMGAPRLEVALQPAP